MCNVSCGHIDEYKSTQGLSSYEILHAYYVSCIAKDSRRRKACDCLCMTESCPTKYQRIHACLSCVFFGCYNGGHIHEHARENGHPLAIDTNFGHVYCFVCGDYQYDAEFEKIAQKQKLRAICKRGGDVNFKWEPNVREVELLSKHIIINLDHIGLRGIINMGNTCYMSVILQSLVHAPVFRNYFLSLKHKCSNQNNSSYFQDQVSDQKSSEYQDRVEFQDQVSNQVASMKALGQVCFACEMSEIVQEFFSGKTGPYLPYRLLHSMWLHAGCFKSSGQHDAHEFLLVLLNYLHLHCQGPNGNISPNDHHCNCIIDTIFTGLLQHEYTCQICKSVTVKPDSFKDISLDTISHNLSPNSDTSGVSSLASSSLGYWLLKTMKFGDTFQKKCDNCQIDTAFSTKMTLKKLPLIISFHIKQSDKEKKKKFINFPEFLDMTPYMPTYKSQTNKEDKPLNGQNRVPNNKFYLCAVVKHNAAASGGGHYISYVRQHKTKWFECNDEVVTAVSIDEVLQTKAYLLFYHRQTLEYEDKKFEVENST